MGRAFRSAQRQVRLSELAEAIGSGRTFRALDLVLRATDRIDEVLEAELPAIMLETLGDGADATVETARRRGSLVLEEPIEQELPPELLPVDPDAIGEDGLGAEPFVVVFDQPRAAAHERDILDFGFDRTNPLAQRWAAEQSAGQIQLISAETRRGVRRMITRIIEEGFAKGRPPIKIARDIRPLIGLTWNQQNYVGNLRTRLARAAVDDVGELALRSRRVTAFGGRMKYNVPPGGFPQARIDNIANRYSQRLLRWRANNIARTETLAAANEGQRQLWAQAAASGDLPSSAKRMWIVTPDRRLCPICLPMRGQVRGLTELFVTGNGDLVLAPPAHPSCRCAQGITTATVSSTTPATQPRPGRPTTRRPGPRTPRSTAPTPPTIEPVPPAGGGGATVVDISPAPLGPVGDLNRRFTWKEFGAPLPRIAARRELLEEALNRALASLPPELRARYIRALQEIPKFKWNVATKSTRSVRVLGQINSQVMESLGETAPSLRKLQLHLSRYNEGYKDWTLLKNKEYMRIIGETRSIRAPRAEVAKVRARMLSEWMDNNPRPEYFRLATADELSETIVHELAHAIDIQAGTSRFNWYEITRQWKVDGMQAEWWKGYWNGDAVIEKLGGEFKVHVGKTATRNELFGYGTTKPVEGFAEAMRLYFRGNSGRASAGIEPITAAEFRVQYPEIAQWIERVILGHG